MRLRNPLLLLPCALALAIAGSASAVTTVITFDELARGFVHGSVVDTDYAGDAGPTLTSIHVDNLAGGPDLAVTFDSGYPGATTDPDLLGPGWSGGNLPGDTLLGNILIAQENATGCGDDVCDDPDDEGARPAADITLAISTPVELFGLDVIDIESSGAERGHLELFEGATSVVIDWMEFEAGGAYDQAVVFGNNSLNRIVLSAGQVGLGAIDKVVVRMGGSGGLDNIVLSTPGGAAPEPGLALWLAPIAALLLRRRS
jgi:hypothetical protein